MPKLPILYERTDIWSRLWQCYLVHTGWGSNHSTIYDESINLENSWDNQLQILVLIAGHSVFHIEWHHTLYSEKSLQEQK